MRAAEGLLRPKGGFRRVERWGYVLWAACLTLYVATRFYASMRWQIRMTALPDGVEALDWSAPLDDVFIHFDFARAAARGHPLEWSEGNGYSSGGTSLSYPFVLALGYWVGFRQLNLMVWAAIVAMTSTFTLLLCARRLFRDLPTWSSWLAPPAVLCIGVLSWSLWSGMELAWFLVLWGLCFVAWDDLLRGEPGAMRHRPTMAAALRLGLTCLMLVATRPEAATTVAIFALSAAIGVARATRLGRGVWTLLLVGAPGALVVIGQAIANRAYTGEFAAAGALVKFEFYHPYMPRAEAWAKWREFVEYQVFRITDYHLSDAKPFGWIPWLLAGVSLVSSRTRRVAWLLAAQATAWVLVVAFNGQVRWQNERYSMPALAWLMLAAALGAGALLSRRWALGRRGLALRLSAACAVLGTLGLFAVHHAPCFEGQRWFFGRASRNIRDQHVRTGRRLRREPTLATRRVGVGDAGAIPYAADLPAFDLIGLGGFHGLPVARASRLGTGPLLELIERLGPAERPDLLAIYPGWWGDLPYWFATRVASQPVFGNVICGGPAKVMFRPDWRAFEGSSSPSTNREVVDEIDFADWQNERAHAFRPPYEPGVETKILPHPREPRRDLFDAGRTLPVGSTWTLTTRSSGVAETLLLRVAPIHKATLLISVDGAAVGEIAVEPGAGWSEPALPLPAATGGTRALGISARDAETVLFHAWIAR